MAPRMVPEGSRGLPGTPLGIDSVFDTLFSSNLAPIGPQFWLPFGLHFGAFFDKFSEPSPGAAPAGLGPDFGAIWAPFWYLFGSFLGTPGHCKNNEKPKGKNTFSRFGDL